MLPETRQKVNEPRLIVAVVKVLVEKITLTISGFENNIRYY